MFIGSYEETVVDVEALSFLDLEFRLSFIFFFKKSFYVSFDMSLTIQGELTLPKMAQTRRNWFVDP